MKTKKTKYKFLYYLTFIILLYIFINYNFKKLKFENNNELFINNFLQYSNYHFITKDEKNDILNNIVNDISNIQVDNPITVIDKVLAYNNTNTNNSVQTFSYVHNNIDDKPRVYIYSTHPNETYKQNDFNVIDASKILEAKLDNLGINAIVESRSVDEYLKQNNLGFDDSYIATRKFLKDALDKYGDFDLIIDLHRDSVSKNVSTVFKTDDKAYAKMMFVMNKNYTNNYNFAKKINEKIYNKYPQITRGIYDKYIDNFNQDLSNKAILLELGTSYNTYEEVINSIDVLSEIIKEIIDEG